MNEGLEEIRHIYRNYMAEELARPEILQAQKKTAALFSVKPRLFFAPVAGTAVCLLVLFSFYFYQNQTGKIVLSQVRLAAIPALNPKPVLDAAPSAGLLQVMVKKVSSRTGSTMVYQKIHHDIPITVIWVFPGGLVE